MVNVSGVPVHPLADGVTVMVAVTGTLPVLVAVNAGIFPVPLAARPMEVLLFVQLNVVPVTAPVKFTGLVVAPLHKVWPAGWATFGVGFTVMVKLSGKPAHPLADGVTVIVAVTGALVELVATNAAIFPLPLAAKPIEVLLLVQLNVVPATAPVRFIGLVDDPLHKV